MTSCGVLHLQDYRSRRERRFGQAMALYSADRERALLLRHLWSGAAACGADRAAVLWVDEYGPGLVHVHVILDLASDRPRRAFSLDPLRLAWSEGVPGLYDSAGSAIRASDRPTDRHLCAIALGSDGLRAWFLVFDGQTPRPRLTPDASATIMFAAGECSAVLMHRDMKQATDTVLIPEGGADRFAAWPVLKDIEGQDADEPLNRRISLRFLVTRVIRAIIDDDLATDQEALEHQVGCVRKEIGKQFMDDPERHCWDGVLDAVDSGEHSALAGAVLGLGVQIEELGHLSGARELYRSAYELAMAMGGGVEAMDAARFAGRTCRRSSQWEKALAWYGVAHGLAFAAGARGKEAVVLAGIANVHKERGNLPKARQVLDEAMEAAVASGDRFALGTAYHDSMAVAGLSGLTDEAIRFGWKAVQYYDREQDRLNALTSLAATFMAAGELDAAESAYAVVARRVESFVYRLYALAGFADVAARRSDREEYERRLAILQQAGFSQGPAAFRAGAWIDRGEAYQAFADVEQARECFQEAVAIAEASQVGQFLIRAEAALRSLDESITRAGSELSPGSSVEEMEEIREELGRMWRCSPVFAGV